MMKKKTGILLCTAVLLLICTAGAYGAIAGYYSAHFFKNTSINGADVSDLTAAEAEARIREQAEEYRLVITGRDDDQETILGSVFDYRYEFDHEVQDLLEEQTAAAWLPAYFADRRDYSIDTAAAYDEEKLREAVAELACMQEENMTAPENAFVSRTADGRYEIVPESGGTKVDPEQMERAVLLAVNSGRQGLNLEAAGCYTAAAVTSEDEALILECDLKNQYAQMVINYYMSGDVTVVLDAATFMDWFFLDENNTPDFDRGAVGAWVDELADTYDTIGTMEPFETSNGTTVLVEAVTYGWQMDREAETEALLGLLTAGETEGRSPAWSVSALTRGENDVGDTYVEIDYTNQRMWYYKNGELLTETPVVTGNVNAGNGSPEGMYAILYKETNAILEGEGYKTPVNYWMPFYGNVGIHDADSWRSTYGGNIYLSSGSHGCINTPTAQASVIYANIEPGTPVICYSSGIDYGYSTGSGGMDTGGEDSLAEEEENIIIIEGNTNETNSGAESGSSAGSADAGTDEPFDIIISDETVWPQTDAGTDELIVID